MKNLSIKFQLFGSLLFPVVALLIFSTNLLLDKISVSSEMEKYAKATELSVKISNLVHETQKERGGASAGFLGSKGTKFKDTLAKQRVLTLEKLNDVKEFTKDFKFEDYNDGFNSFYKQGMSELDRLSNIRTRVDGLQISVQEEVAYYTKINALLLNTVGEIGKMMSDTGLAKSLNAYANFLLSKERAGIERAVLSNTFAADKFGKGGMYEKFIVLVTEQNSYLESFKLTAGKDFVKFFEETVQGEPVDKVNEMRESAYKNHATGGFGGVDAPYWFATITQKINLLKKTENYFADQILLEMKEKLSAANKTKALFLTLFAISLVSLIILMFVIVKVVLMNINRLSASVHDLTSGNGDLTKRLIMKEKNEVRVLYDSINDFVENIDVNLSNTLTHVSKAGGDAVVPLISIVSDTTLSAHNSYEVSNQVSAASQEMSDTINEIASNVHEASRLMQEAVDVASTGKSRIDNVNNSSSEVQAVMNDLKMQINNLQQEAERIGDVVSVINDIADQTNLLALNAAIEAARAGGEAGRGFAVVADEVRKLAEKTQQSTSEIASVINKVRTDVMDTVANTDSASDAIARQSEDIAGGVSETFETIVDSVENVNGNMESIAAAMEEQTATTVEISESIKTVAKDASLMLNKSEDLSEATNLIVNALHMMDDEFAKFKLSNKAIPLIRAKIAHAVFLSNVQRTVQDSSFTFKVTNHHECGFGQIYYNEVKDVFGEYKEYSDIEPLHKKVHEFGIEIVNAASNQSVATQQDSYEGFRHVVGEMMVKLNILIDKINSK